MTGEVRVLGTGLGWLGGGIESIQTNIEELIRNAQDEILVAAYSIGSGATEFVGFLEKAAGRDVDVRVIVNRFHDHPKSVRDNLIEVARIRPKFKLYYFAPVDGSDLHAKLIIADRRRAIIGSANLSRRGFVANHELAVLLEHREVAVLAKALDLLVARGLAREILP